MATVYSCLPWKLQVAADPDSSDIRSVLESSPVSSVQAAGPSQISPRGSAQRDVIDHDASRSGICDYVAAVSCIPCASRKFQLLNLPVFCSCSKLTGVFGTGCGTLADLAQAAAHAVVAASRRAVAAAELDGRRRRRCGERLPSRLPLQADRVQGPQRGVARPRGLLFGTVAGFCTTSNCPASDLSEWVS